MTAWNKLMEERGSRSDMPMKPQVVTYHLNKLLDSNAIVSSDSGTIATWTARYIEIRDQMQFSLSGSLATMANGLPYSIGAAVAFPGRQVVCVVGDGGLTMLMGEIATLVKYKLPVKVIVIKNNVLGEIKWEQMAQEGNPQFGVDLQPIDFAGYARCCGAAGFTIEDPKDAESILRQALAHPGPAVIEAVVDPNEPPLPGNISAEQALHFAESLGKGEKDRWKIIRTVLEDKIREVDLAMKNPERVRSNSDRAARKPVGPDRLRFAQECSSSFRLLAGDRSWRGDWFGGRPDSSAGTGRREESWRKAGVRTMVRTFQPGSVESNHHGRGSHTSAAPETHWQLFHGAVRVGFESARNVGTCILCGHALLWRHNAHHP